MNQTKPPEYTDVLSEYSPVEPTELILERASIPLSYTEQKGVMQILDASGRFYAVVDQGESGVAEREELQRIASSMENVTATLAGHANYGIDQTEMSAYVKHQLWCTKTPESVVGKVCANVNKGKQAALHDLHRGMFVVEGVSPEEFAQSLADYFNDPDNPAGTVAYMARFDSPHSDELIRDNSRKVIVGFRHEDGESYSGEIQVHGTDGYARYVESTEQYKSRRSPEREEAKKMFLGGLALRAEAAGL